MITREHGIFVKRSFAEAFNVKDGRRIVLLWEDYTPDARLIRVLLLNELLTKVDSVHVPVSQTQADVHDERVVLFKPFAPQPLRNLWRQVREYIGL